MLILDLTRSQSQSVAKLHNKNGSRLTRVSIASALWSTCSYISKSWLSPLCWSTCPSFSLLSAIGTYVKTSNPHPASAVKSLGLRSRAGFMAQPELSPREQERTMIRRPMTTGSRPLGTPRFLESKMAKTMRRRSVVDTTWRGRKCSGVQSAFCSLKTTRSIKR